MCGSSSWESRGQAVALLSSPIDFFLEQSSVRGSLEGLEAVCDGFAFLERAQRDPEIAPAIAQLRPGGLSALADLLSFMVTVTEGTRLAAHRNDWLFLESQIAFVLNGLVWAQLLEEWTFSIPDANREAFLRAFCRQAGCERELDTVLLPQSLRQGSDALVTMMLSLVGLFDTHSPRLDVQGVQVLVRLKQCPDWITETTHNDLFPLQEVLDRVVAALIRLPGYVGILLDGSFASTYKRDGFSDLDLHVICTEVPDDSARDTLLEALGVPQSFRFGVCEYFRVDAVGVEVRFVSMPNQENALRKLREEGREPAMMNYADERWQLGHAVSAYEWATGQILSDPTGALLAFRQQANSFPPALETAIRQASTSTWNRYSSAYQEADRRQDRVSALTALHACAEAALRLLLASHGVYSNPLFAKWMPHEIANLPAGKKREMGALLEHMPSGIPGPMPERFHRLALLWSGLERDRLGRA